MGIPELFEGIDRGRLIVRDNAANSDYLTDHSKLKEAMLSRDHPWKRRCDKPLKDVFGVADASLYFFH